MLCNDATLAAPTPERPEWTAVGDPLEAALVTFAARCGLDPRAVRCGRPGRGWPNTPSRRPPGG
ncbi:hypothetical protein ABT214_18550 [Micromonospora purpureochromogenes]|uniref:hypothetical protein n=1 Tax=Micromonospora purpureochromogenes TaxID=47872 RepID=UPI00332F5CEC